MKLNNIKEAAFFERTAYWKDHGWGSMLVYVAPPKEGSHSYTCEYVMFRQEGGFKREVLNQDLLEAYNKGKE